MRLLQIIWVTILLAGSAAETPVDAADSWLRFRGSAGDGVVRAPARLPPLSWTGDAEDRVRWRTELPGEGWSSPLVTDDELLLTAAVPVGNSDDRELVLLQFDRTTGRLQSPVKIFDQPAAETPGIHSKNTHASPTPWIEDSRVFVHFGYQGTAAVDRQGELLWRNRELRFPPVHGNGGSPILVDGRLIFTCDGNASPYVAALDAATGRLAWRTERPVDAPRKFSFCTPTAIEVRGQTQVICPGSDCVLALDPASGEVLWQVTYDGYSVVPKPVYADGLVFVCTGFGPTQVMAIDPTGRGDVTETHVRWTLDRGAPKTPSLIAHEGLLYVVSDDGVLTVLETETGDRVYRARLGGKYSASPVLIGDRIYFASEEGTVKVTRAGDRYEELAVNEMGERVLASPAIVDGALYIRTEEALYRIE